MKVFLSLILFFAIAALLLAGCATECPTSRGICGAALLKQMKPKASLDFFSGGGVSGDFTAKQKKFQFDVVFLEGGFSPCPKSKSHFVVGTQSKEGIAIREILQKEKPWEWQSTQFEAFANELFFNGDFGGKNWSFKTIYPNPKFEAFVDELREALMQ